MSAINIASDDILKFTEMLAVERNIQKEQILHALEKAFEEAIKGKFGADYNIVVNVNRKDGIISVSKALEVVEKSDISSVYKQIAVEDAIKLNKDAKVGDVINANIPNLEVGSDVVAKVRSSLLKQIHQIGREGEYEEFSKLVGGLVQGVIKRILPSGIVVVLGKTECFVAKRDLLFQEVGTYKLNDRIYIAIKSVERSERGFQVFGTRTSEQFLVKLFAQMIPEIEEGIIEIKALAREAGSRSKVAVFCIDRTKDPVGVCIGGKGKKIMSISKELKDEKIDVIEWSPEPDVLLQNCLKGIPYEAIERVDEHVIEAVISSEFISAAIGRKGQNASLISKIIGLTVNFVTKDDKIAAKSKEFDAKTSSIVEIIGVDEIIAKILISEGFDTITKISAADVSKLSSLQGFNAEIAEQIKTRCAEIVEGLSQDAFAKDLLSVSMPVEVIFMLFQNDINSDVALASLSVDDFIDYLGDWSLSVLGVSKQQISALIMQKRKDLGLIE